MHNATLASSLTLIALLVPGCKSPSPGWNNHDALAAESVEVRLDGSAEPVEIEYHILPEAVPANVMAAMDALHPGGTAVAAEKEYNGSTLYWEVTKLVDGREFEAMFRENGELHSEELEVRASDVPAVVREAARNHLDGQITKWEEIRDGERELFEYHAKILVGDRKYKVRLSTAGVVLGTVREVPAEIEIPVS